MKNHCSKSKLHVFLMVLCCTVPILVLGALYLTKAQATSWGNFLSFGAILLCPLMHLVMLLFIGGKGDEKTTDKKSQCH